jgi:hypothetical protein
MAPVVEKSSGENAQNHGDEGECLSNAHVAMHFPVFI